MNLKFTRKNTLLAAASTALFALAAPAAHAGVLMCHNQGSGPPMNPNPLGTYLESTIQTSPSGDWGQGRLGFIADADASTQCPQGSYEVGYAATSDEISRLIRETTGDGTPDPNLVRYNQGGTTDNPGTVSVAAGVNGTDAVNVDQLNNGMSTTLNNANYYTDSKVSEAVNVANNYTDTKLGDAYAYTDNSVLNAINVSNEYTDSKFGDSIAYTDEKTKYFKANSTGADSVVTGMDSIAIGPGTVVSGDRSIAGGANALASGDDSVVFGADAKGTGTGAVAVGSGAQANSAGDVAMGHGAIAEGVDGVGSAVAIGAGNRASGAGAVAIGDPTIAVGTGAIAMGFNAISSDDGTATGGAADGAVALGNEAIATGQGSVAMGNQSTTGGAFGIAIGDAAHSLQGNGIALGSGATATNANDVALGAGSTTREAVATTGATINSVHYAFAGTTPTSTVSIGSEGNERTLTNLAAGRLSADSTDGVNGSQLHATNQAINAIGANIAGNNSKDLPGASAPGENSVAIGPGSVADRDNTISVGAPGNERQITNVADGIAPNDATNLGQVQEMVRGGTQEAVQQANSYTNQQIQALDAKTQKQMAGVGAMAMASSALMPNARAEGNSSISLAAGTYGGESAIAAGVNYYASNQVLLNAKVAATTAGPSRVGFAVGATIGF